MAESQQKLESTETHSTKKGPNEAQYFPNHAPQYFNPSAQPQFCWNGIFCGKPGEEQGAGGQALWGAPGQAAEDWLPEDRQGHPVQKNSIGLVKLLHLHLLLHGLGFLVNLQEAKLLLLGPGLTKELGRLLLVLLLPLGRSRHFVDKMGLDLVWLQCDVLQHAF